MELSGHEDKEQQKHQDEQPCPNPDMPNMPDEGDACCMHQALMYTGHPHTQKWWGRSSQSLYSNSPQCSG